MLIGTVVETNFRRAMDERVPVEFEHYFSGDGAEAWFKFLIYPQPGDGILLYLRETTSTQRTEQALAGFRATGRCGAVGGKHCPRDQQSARGGDEPAVSGKDGRYSGRQHAKLAGCGRS